jgi:hypothetical protein
VDTELMMIFLEAAVPRWAARVWSWTPDRRAAEAEDIAWVIACGADALFRPEDKPTPAQMRLPAPHQLTRQQMDDGVKARDYRPAEVFNAIATGLAIGALLPGGVTWHGAHWCAAPHGTCPGVLTAWLPGVTG